MGAVFSNNGDNALKIIRFLFLGRWLKTVFTVFFLIIGGAVI
jgi:hypothetical protein